MKSIIISIFSCIVLIFSGCGDVDALQYDIGENDPSEETGTVSEEADVREEAADIFVYVCGAVRKPGVYELPAGSRVFEAVEAAGGMNEDADTRILNQAQLLTDGEQITVYTVEEAAAEASESVPGQHQDDGLININIAGVSELSTLPGIGQSKAEAIVAYREQNGAFGSPSDICNVTGIKEKLYARISSLITV